MKIFALGDLHLSNGTDKPMDIFGKAWEGHAELIKSSWLEAVSQEDIVIIAGDISWGLKDDELMPDFEWIHELPGKKILIKGNHDIWWNSTSKLNKLYDDMYFLQSDAYETDKFIICGTRGWMCPEVSGFTEHDMKLYNRENARMQLALERGRKMSPDKDIIVAMHFPPAADDHSSSGFTELFEQYGVKKVVYGHLHGQDAWRNAIEGTRNGVEYLLVSCDYTGFVPVKICEIG